LNKDQCKTEIVKAFAKLIQTPVDVDVNIDVPVKAEKTRPKIVNVEKKTQFGNRTAGKTTIVGCI
jgi:hypothetical protein